MSAPAPATVAVTGVSGPRTPVALPAEEASKASAAFTDVRAARWAGWIFAGLGLLLSVALHWRLRDMAFDDTYIHLRIARNLLRTGRAWFNPGERVMATSSPLWTLLLAGLRVPGHPVVLPVLEAVLLWVSAVLGFQVVRRSLAPLPRAGAFAIAAVAALITSALLLPSSVGQMETPLAIALLLAAWRCALLGAWSCAMPDRSGSLPQVTLPLLALAACTRLEVLPVLFLAALSALVVQRKRALAGVATATGIVAGAAGWTYWQFGVLLPNSVRAKQVTYSFTFAQAVHQFYAFRLRDEVFLALLVALLGAGIWTAFGRAPSGLEGGSQELRSQRLGLAAVLSALLLVANYVVHHTVIFDWYRPLVFVPLALGLLICGASFTALRSAFARGQRLWRWAVGLGSVACVLLMTAEPLRKAGTLLLAGMQPTAAAESRVDDGDSARVQGYLEVGQKLQALCPGSRLLTPEIGALGWAFDGYVYDSFGIASPEALKYQPLPAPYPRGGTPAAYVLAVMPDVMVSYRVLDWQPHSTPAVMSRYDLMELPPSPRSRRGGLLDHGWRSSASLDVWVRKDGGCQRGVLEGPLRRGWE